jgi:hypothetical protein
MGFRDLLPVKQLPSEEAVKGLEYSESQLAYAESRDSLVSRLASWLNDRNDENHYGDALTISYTRKGKRRA